MKKTEDLAFEYQSRVHKAAAPEGYEIIQSPYEQVRRDDLKYTANNAWAEIGGSEGIRALGFYLVARKIHQ
jgi:hypothetical protein